MKAIIRNNPNIDSFSGVFWNTEDVSFDFSLIELIPKVKILHIYINTKDISGLSSLLTLDHLTEIYLNCFGNSLNKLLRELAKNGVLKTMQLSEIAVDDDFFNTLSSFEELEVLIVAPPFSGMDKFWKLNPSIAWPKKLKRMRLLYIEFTTNIFISTIQQLTNLSEIDIDECGVPLYDHVNFTDVGTLGQQIINVIRHSSNQQQKLNIILVNFGRNSYWNTNISSSVIKLHS